MSMLVAWHDVECGSYNADLPLWRELAAAAGGPVLDVGAGTGRVALDLARAGHDVTALDREPELLVALADRAGAAGLTVPTVCADARDFALGRRFALIVVPMQTLQLLDERAGFLRCAATHLERGGLLAAAITERLEHFDAADALPHPDVGEVGGARLISQPTAVLSRAHATRIERVRRTLAPDGSWTEEDDAIELAHMTVAQLEDGGRAAGLTPEPARSIAPTEEHVGSEVVMLRG